MKNLAYLASSLGTLALMGSATAQTACLTPHFTSAKTFPVSSYTSGVATADFNGDGKLDLASVDLDDQRISVQNGDGAGGFGSPVHYPTGADPQSIEVADLNGDGAMDLIVPNAGSNNVSILLGNGGGGFGNTVYVTAGAVPAAAAVGDFNGDGKADLAVVNYEAANLMIRLGDGTGAFGSPAYASVGSGALSVALADLNGDGKLDAAVTHAISGNVSILLGNGQGAMGTATNFTAGLTPRGVTAGDFNADGKADLAVANYGSNSIFGGTVPGNISVLLNNAATGAAVPGFSAATHFSAGVNAFGIRSGDFNGDSKLDLVTGNATSNDVSVLLGNGLGSFGVARNFFGGYGAPDVAMGDFNGDGRLDVTAIFSSVILGAVLLGDGAGGLDGTENYPVGDSPGSLATADFNGDGHLDLATQVDENLRLSILLNNGSGSFHPANHYLGGTSTRNLVAGDFNGDGKSDLVTANSDFPTYGFSLLLNDGVGGFGSMTDFPGLYADSLAVGDLNGDGKLDLALANFNSGNVSIFPGDGLGGFGAALTFPVGGLPGRLMVADFNADGKPDLATTNSESTGAVSILLNTTGAAPNSPPAFGGATNFPVNSPQSLTGADFNGDGKLDLGVSTSSNAAVLLGNGSGGVGAALYAPSTNFTNHENHGVAAADFSGDGTPDLALAGRVIVGVLFGNGTGGFRVPGDFLVPSGSQTPMVTGDFNGDGRPDLATVNIEADNVTVLLNTCIDAETDLRLTIAESPNPVRNGDTVTYTITVTNLGPSLANSVVVSDNLPAGLAFVSSTATGGGVSGGTGNARTISYAALAVGASETITLVATVDCAVPDGALGNTATASSTTTDPVPVNDSASSITMVSNPPMLSLASETFTASGGTGSVSLDLPCRSWTVTSNSDWVTVTSSASGSGSTNVNYSVAANTGPPRTGVLTIAGLTFPVHQFSPAAISDCNTPMFGAASPWPTGNQATSSVSAEFNGDGNPDLAITSSNDANVAILLGNGTGGFGSPTILNGEVAPQASAVGDFNGDGMLDLAVANYPSENVSIFAGDGNGGFSAATNFNAGVNGVSLAAGDFDRDGKLDLAVAINNKIAILRNTFNGTPGSIPSFSAPAHFALGVTPTSVTVGDVNLDGRADLVTANGHINKISVLLGDGVGGFGGASSFDTGSSPHSVAIGDLNNDFKPDLAVAVENANTISILLGDGTGNFGLPTDYAVGSKPRSIVAADFNHDFKLDLAVANRYSGTVSVLFNTSVGTPAISTFSASSQFAVGVNAAFNLSSMVAADFDRDGKTDIAATRFDGGVFLLANSCGVSTDLGITMTGSPDPVSRGTNLTYTITVTNHGAVAATNVIVSNTLATGLQFVSSSATGGVSGGSGNNRTITFATLVAGATSVISLVASVECSLFNTTTLANTATVGSAIFDPTPGNDLASISTTTIYAPVLISPASQTFSELAGNGAIEIMSPCVSWSSSRDVSWIALINGTGSGNGFLTYSVTANDSGAPRTGVITVYGAGPQQTFTVTQTTPCVYSISPGMVGVSASVGTGAVLVTTAGGCAWTAISNAAWISIDTGASGTGSGTVTYSVEHNPGSQRIGTITIAGQTFTVTQSECAYVIYPEEKAFTASSGSATLSVSTSNFCSWTAVSNAPWITITSGSGASGNGLVEYEVAENSAGPRTGTMTIAGQVFTVTQSDTAPLALVVTNTNNSGPGSFRQALLESNGNNVPGHPNTIDFDIAGALTISPASNLPVVMNPVAINGINSSGSRVVLSGSGTDDFFYLEIRATNCTLRGLVINQCDYGLYITRNDNVVENCYIGTDAAGTADLGNDGVGIHITSHNNRIGGSAPGTGNLISFNVDSGVAVYGTGNVVQNNYISRNGTDASISSGKGGVELDGSNNLLGGTSAGTGNTIVFNGGPGVLSFGGTENVIRGNSIHSNAGLGIDLHAFGVTANDADDTDTGANDKQNFPILTGVHPGSTVIEGTLNSTPETQFTIEFFSSVICDDSGHGEGQTLVGTATITTDPSGNAPINVTFPTTVQAGHFITATATGPSGTSEFAACLSMSASNPITFVPPSEVPGSRILISGTAFLNASAVNINGVSANFVVDSETQITATVPASATTGPISVTTSSGTATSGLSFTVLADTDIDGMSNDFEQQHFGSPTGGDAAEDSDGDGATNRDEYLAGTNPISSASHFRIASMVRETNGIVNFTFTSVNGKAYQAEYTDTLSPTGTWTPLQTNIVGTGATISVVDNGANGEPRRIYRVKITP